MDYLILFSYVLLVTFHNFLFYLMIACIIRVFTVKYSPYSSIFVGCYTLAHSLYGGCPVLEFENVFARYLNLPLNNVGDVYVLFGGLAWVMRVVLFIAAIGLITNAYKTWNKAEQPFTIENIFAKSRKENLHAVLIKPAA